MNQREQFVTVYRLAAKSLEVAWREFDNTLGDQACGPLLRALGEALCGQFNYWIAWHEAGGLGTEEFVFRLANPRAPELSVLIYLSLSDEGCAIHLWMPNDRMSELLRCAQDVFLEGEASDTTAALGLTYRDLADFRALQELRVEGPARPNFASIETVWAGRAFCVTGEWVPAPL